MNKPHIPFDKDWRKTVEAWLVNPRNVSAEDAGLDQLPNTSCGRDGLFETADDDVLDGDGTWTVEM